MRRSTGTAARADRPTEAAGGGAETSVFGRSRAGAGGAAGAEAMDNIGADSTGVDSDRYPFDEGATRVPGAESDDTGKGMKDATTSRSRDGRVVTDGAAGAIWRADAENADGETSSAGGAKLTTADPISTGPRAAMTRTAGRVANHAQVITTISNVAAHATAMTAVRSEGTFSRSQTTTETLSTGAGR